MKVLAVGTLVTLLFAMPAVTLAAEQAAEVEKAGASYTLAMEGMT